MVLALALAAPSLAFQTAGAKQGITTLKSTAMEKSEPVTMPASSPRWGDSTLNELQSQLGVPNFAYDPLNLAKMDFADLDQAGTIGWLRHAVSSE